MIKIILGAFIIVLISCESEKSPIMTDYYFDLKNRSAKSMDLSELRTGKTYLSVYSQIYESSMYKKHNLTITVSIRNADVQNKGYLLKADHFDTNGALLKEYLDEPIFIEPLETVEIVINEDDKSGGTGGNFIFHWMTEGNVDPLFEAVMISAKSQQGISFVTNGVRIE